MAPIAAGETVPSLSLKREGGAESFTEADFDGRTTVLVFYPFAFSPVCSDQLSLYESVREEFDRLGVVLYGVSCDAVWSQSAFKDKLGVSIEQLSDFEPKGEVSRALGVYHPGGFPQRALVIVGPDRKVVWSYQADSPGDLPGANLIFDALSGAAA